MVVVSSRLSCLDFKKPAGTTFALTKTRPELDSQDTVVSSVMAVDWIGFSYAAAIAFGGFMGYKRKSSVMSLMAGLVFGGLSAYGAYNTSSDPKDIKVLMLSSGVLSIVMGLRYRKSGKLMPAGVMAGLSLLMVFRLLLLIMV